MIRSHSKHNKTPMQILHYEFTNRELHKLLCAEIKISSINYNLSSISDWQKFMGLTVADMASFIGYPIDKNMRLIELLSLCALTTTLTNINDANVEFYPGVLTQQSDASLINMIGKDSTDGLIMYKKNNENRAFAVEQKSSMINPKTGVKSNATDNFLSWLRNLRKQKIGVKQSHIWWVFNVMPYGISDSFDFQLDDATKAIRSEFPESTFGSFCLFSLEDGYIMVVCMAIQEKLLNMTDEEIEEFIYKNSRKFSFSLK